MAEQETGNPLLTEKTGVMNLRHDSVINHTANLQKQVFDSTSETSQEDGSLRFLLFFCSVSARLLLFNFLINQLNVYKTIST